MIDLINMNAELEPLVDEFIPTEEEERDFWNGEGHIEFFVIQNTEEDFEIEVLDYSGCAGGLDEGMGIDYWIKEVEGLHRDPTVRLREGRTYCINGLTVTWTRGDGWEIDDDAEYEFESLTENWSLDVWLPHKIKMIWWRLIGWRINRWKQGV